MSPVSERILSDSNDSGYYSGHEETLSDSNTNQQVNSRRKMGILGRSFSDPPMPVDLLEKRRMSRSNSDVAKESKMNKASEEPFELLESASKNPNITDTRNTTNATSDFSELKGPFKTHVRALLTKSNHSISSDDNDNDERETTSRLSHPHHGTARRWRQIQDEKHGLEQENNKVRTAREKRKLKWSINRKRE
jgi:hypothetical protein